jgi:inosose dehydratase
VPPRLANAPVSFGAWSLEVSRAAGVPSAERVLAAVAGAGYDGIELGPPGFLGDRATLRGRLAAHGLELAGGYVPLHLGDGDLAPLEATLELFDAAGGTPRGVLADDGDRDEPADPPRLAAAVAEAADRARSRGYEPCFHHHMGTRIQTPDEIERLLDAVDVPLLLDTGHLVAAGGDPVEALRRWRDRIDYLHVKDVDLGRVRAAPSWAEAWRGNVFCELGTGDADVAGFLRELGGFDGWIVVEQDWVARPGDEDGEAQVAAQERNRAWLAARLRRA